MARKGKGIVLIYCDIPDSKHEEEFNAWYNTEHVPQLLGLPGVLDAGRYVAVKGGPRYLAVYELESAEVVQSPEFKNRPITAWEKRISPRVVGANFTAVVGQQIFPDGVEKPDRGMAPALQIGRMSVAEGIEAQWNAWYSGEYIPAFLSVPGVIHARRFRVARGEARYATVYEFETETVPESADWAQRRDVPSSVPMRNAMIMAPGSPGVYRRILP